MTATMLKAVIVRSGMAGFISPGLTTWLLRRLHLVEA